MERKEFLNKMALSSFGLLSAGPVAGSWAKGLIDVNENCTRSRILFDEDWRFHAGDVQGGKQPGYDDNGWRRLDLPHDWGIEGQFNKDNPAGAQGAYLPGGIGWYRKSFPWNPSWKGRKLSIDFDGIYMKSDVWINGHHLGHRPNGYISFRYDLTPYLQKGKNIIAARVDNARQPSARWYTGSGINRHVWLTLMNPVHVGHWGTWVRTPKVGAEQALVHVTTQIVNERASQQQLRVEQNLYSRHGNTVARTQQHVTLKTGSSAVVDQHMQVRYPHLWSPDDPYLYRMETIIKDGHQTFDTYHTRLGIRTLKFSPEWGFRINGKNTLIKGVANHENGGGAVGSAIPDGLLYRRLKLLKKMGCNAIRTAHNPRRPQFYDFCDELGLMVVNEAFDGWDQPKATYDYGRYFADWWKKDLTSFIRRDRNHPCVIMWSIGNEVRGFTQDRQKQLVKAVRTLDSTRAITQGAGRGAKERHLDVAGFNGGGEQKGVLKNFHNDHPDSPMLGTEMTHTLQTRGVYRTQTQYRLRDFPAPWEKGKSWANFKDKVHLVPDLSEEEIFTDVPQIYRSSYDNAFVRINVRDQFKHNSRYPYLMGSFRWSGFDYLGEAFNKWPTRATDFGIIDLSGFPKDHYYLYQSLWADRPMVHLLPHWTHPGKEGTRIPMVAYSNCQRVELFLDGQSLGEQSMDSNELQRVWHVPYRPGKLVAVARDVDGQNLAEATRQTAGAAAAMQMKAEQTALRANGRDVTRLEVSVVDKNGIVVPDATNSIRFDLTGPGKLVGVENGDIADLASTQSNHRKAFQGKCMGLVQAGGRAGTLEVTVRSGGLQSDQLTMQIS